MQENNLEQENINNENLLEIENQNKILEENQINNNVNNIFDEHDDILKNDQMLNEDNKDDNYVTDSDIDDPRYMPSGNVLDNNQVDIQQQQQQNIDNHNKSEIFLKSKVMALQNDANLANQTMKELENENNLLRTEILKNKEKIQSKDGLNYEFQNLFTVFKQRFEQYEEKNNSLQNYIKELEDKLALKEREIQQNNKLKNIKVDSKVNNAQLFNELQNNFTEKSKLLNKEYLDKEEKIKNKYYQELENTSKKMEELKIENDKLKYDISNNKIEIEGLESQLEEKENRNKSSVDKKETEVENLKEIK